MFARGEQVADHRFCGPRLFPARAPHRNIESPSSTKSRTTQTGRSVLRADQDISSESRATRKLSTRLNGPTVQVIAGIPQPTVPHGLHRFRTQGRLGKHSPGVPGGELIRSSHWRLLPRNYSGHFFRLGRESRLAVNRPAALPPPDLGLPYPSERRFPPTTDNQPCIPPPPPTPSPQPHETGPKPQFSFI